MEKFVDNLSRQLANAVSRRDMLGIASRTIFTGLLASTGIGQLWARDRASNSSSLHNCPSCGDADCVRCNADTGKCKNKCERCAAATLCAEAQQFAPYIILQNFLVAAHFSSGE